MDQLNGQSGDEQEKDGEQLRLPNAADSESNDNMPENPANFDLVASTMDIRFFLLCIRRMRQSLDEKRWLDVQACAECFKQMVRHPIECTLLRWF